jgi:hypothetical protein
MHFCCRGKVLCTRMHKLLERLRGISSRSSVCIAQTNNDVVGGSRSAKRRIQPRNIMEALRRYLKADTNGLQPRRWGGGGRRLHMPHRYA